MNASGSAWQSAFWPASAFQSALIVFWTIASPGVHAGEAVKTVPVDHAAKMEKGLELFKSEVRGILKGHCIKCHGGEITKGEFDLTTREGLIKGGSQGPAVELGAGKESLLCKLISHADEPAMPDEAPKLPERAIASIERWIDLGAPYDKPLIEDDPLTHGGTITEADRSFWSFRPLVEPQVPPVVDASWCAGTIDRFILAKLEAKGIHANPPVDRRKLIRRAKFDLLGLPPTSEEIDDFVNDPAADAYERLIDRLLASPHYGERWGRHWLDLARFAESHGYEQDYDRPTAYHYRDFVIKALNEDMPYDRFVKLQIAGDELEPDNPLAMMATGYLGAGVHATQITASQVEKERYDELDDMTQTLGTSLLGLTIGCARCHDHKFDPIKQYDYYRILSTFTTTVRSEIELNLNPQEYARAKADFDREHAPLVEKLAQYEREELPGKFAGWLAAPIHVEPPAGRWLIVKPYEIHTQSKSKLEPQPDGSLVASGPNENFEIYDLKFDTPLAKITAVRIEALPHPSLPQGGPGRAGNGNFALSEIRMSAVARQASGKGQILPLTDARASYEQAGFAASGALDPSAENAWAVDGNIGRRSAAEFRLKSPLELAGGAKFTISLHFSNNVHHALGRLRVAICTSDESLAPLAEHAAHDVVVDAQRILKTSQDRWSAADRTVLLKWYASVDPKVLELQKAIDAHQEDAPRPNLTRALVTSEGLPPLRLHTQGADFFEKTYFLKRGDLSQKQGEAAPGFLRVLVRADEGESRWKTPAPKGWRTSYRRTALATWLTDVDRGAGNLVARVIANRLWQHHLGRGIVATPSDFGSQGERPTHGELLDWLALRLVDDGWRLKPLHKLIMTSAVYRQGDAVDPVRGAVDLDNKLWWRRAPQRLEGEAIRDSMLAISGTLDPTMFGPGSLDEAQRRRSIYFTIKRSRMIPMMALFDGPDALQGLGQRATTTVAPQALALLNNPQVQTYAANFGKQLAPTAAHSMRDAVRQGYLTALGRGPSDEELEDAVAFIGVQYADYSARSHQPLALSLADFCQVLMSLNEFVYIE